MYTATITGKSIQRAARQYVVDVEFSDGTTSFTEQFRFGLDISFDTVKLHIKQYMTKLENATTSVEAIPEGVLDLSGVTEYTPTPAENAREAWFRDFGRLEKVQHLIDLGVLKGTETAVKNLKTRVSDNFKAAYIADM